MISKFIFALIITSSQLLFSQKTDTVYYDKEWEKCPKDLAFYYGIRKVDATYSGSETAYYITGEKHSSKKLKNGSEQGEATWWYKNGQKWCVGHYNLGIEDGPYIFWYPNGKLQEEGIYVNGARDDNWKYYDKSGFRFYEYNEVNKKPLFLNAKDEENSIKLFGEYLVAQNYPDEVKKMNLQGKVLIEFTVDEFGKVINVNVAKGINHFLDEAARKTIESLPNWTPASHDSKNVRVKVVVPISYK